MEAYEDIASLPDLGDEDAEGDADEDDGVEEVPLDNTALRERLVNVEAADRAEADEEQRPESRAAKRHKKRKHQSEDPNSLQSLKRQLTEAKRSAAAGSSSGPTADVNNADSAGAANPQV